MYKWRPPHFADSKAAMWFELLPPKSPVADVISGNCSKQKAGIVCLRGVGFNTFSLKNALSIQHPQNPSAATSGLLLS